MNRINMEKNKNFRVVILSQEEDKINTLKGLLSKYYLLNITKICRHEAEAIEYLNNHKVSLFFFTFKCFLHFGLEVKSLYFGMDSMKAFL